MLSVRNISDCDSNLSISRTIEVCTTSSITTEGDCLSRGKLLSLSDFSNACLTICCNCNTTNYVSLGENTTNLRICSNRNCKSTTCDSINLSLKFLTLSSTKSSNLRCGSKIVNYFICIGESRPLSCTITYLKEPGIGFDTDFTLKKDYISIPS